MRAPEDTRDGIEWHWMHRVTPFLNAWKVTAALFVIFLWQSRDCTVRDLPVAVPGCPGRDRPAGHADPADRDRRPAAGRTHRARRELPGVVPHPLRHLHRERVSALRHPVP